MIPSTLMTVLVAIAVAIMAAGIIDVIRGGRVRFAAVGKRRWHWVLLMISFGPLAVLLYAAAVRPQVLHPQLYEDEPVLAAAESTPIGRPMQWSSALDE